MRQLRLVPPGAAEASSGGAATAPGTAALLLETADGAERFLLPVDPALRDAVVITSTGADTRPARAVGDAGAPSRSVTPREVQVRVRGGESAEAVAQSTGASLEWVMRFATPVLAERHRIAVEARRAKARRSTTDGDVVTFGDAVAARFSAHGIDPDTVSWDAHRRDDGSWALVARWVGGQDEHTAEWTYHLTSGRTVTPSDDTAAELLSDRPIRPITPTPPPAAEPVLSLAPPLGAGVVVFPAMPDAHTGPLPRAVADESPVQPAAEASAMSARRNAGDEDDAPDAAAAAPDEPPLPLGLPAPLRLESPPTRPSANRAQRAQKGRRTTGAATQSQDDKNARPHVPSWDDILLGVRRKQD